MSDFPSPRLESVRKISSAGLWPACRQDDGATSASFRTGSKIGLRLTTVRTSARVDIIVPNTDETD